MVENTSQEEKIIIIGSGPSGLTAAIYAARAGLSPLLIEGFQSGGQPGGQLMTTTEVENFPGFENGIMGPELIERIKAQAQRFQTRFVSEDIEKVDFTSKPFSLFSGSKTWKTHCLIIATGASANILDHPAVKKYWGKGISACATCDGALPVFRNKPICVIGGGDSAIEEAQFLSRFASRIYLIHRRDKFRASKAMQDKLLSNSKIEAVFDSVIEDISGSNFVEIVKVKNVNTGQITEIQAKGIFMAIGHTPNTAFLNNSLELDEKKYIRVKHPTTATSVDGVFACGDVTDPRYRQAISAAGSGCCAALDAEKWLSEKGIE
ncbi:MAG: thioredoxin-disulfide reductase [Candidatus Riflebacteria bacterium]|nr:thioredoxin-disulfide reductase [Candidatus Riflebacteria bacterium]